MKIIKKISLLVIIVLMSRQLAAQGTPTCGGTNSPLPSWYTPNWDWLDSSPSNWGAQILTGTVSMGSPFTSNTNTNDMLKVIDGLDYQRDQGWVLMAKDFGAIGQSNAANATPYFMLYNKYKGVIRVFMYYGNTNPFVNKASVILKWSPNNGALANNSLLTLANSYALANENYPVSNNAEKHINYMNQVSNSGAWGVTEYLVNFDPNTVKNVGNFQYLNFDFKLSNAASISLGGDFSFSTESATAKSPPAPTANSGNPNWLDYVVTGKNALSKAPKASEITSGFDNIANGVNTIDEKFCNNFTRDLHNMNNSIQTGKLKQFLIGTAQLTEGVGGLLGVAGTVLELFMSKSNGAVATNTESFMQPTLSKGTLTLSGTIISESNPLSITLQQPGTSHKYANGTVNCPNLPIYDCPLGVVSVQEAPSIEVRTWTEPEKAGTYAYSIDFQTPVAGCDPPPVQFNQIVIGTVNSANLYRRNTSCPAAFATKTMKSYKVTGDVKLALNGAAGVTIISTQAALFFEIKNNGGTPAISLTQTDVPTPPACFSGVFGLLPTNCPFIWSGSSANAVYSNTVSTYTETQPFKNYTKNLLDQGLLNLSYYDLASGYHKFQTPFIDIDKFKNTAITIEDACNVYLKVLVTMKPTNLSDDQTPIVQLVTYQIPTNKYTTNGGTTPYVMTCDQRRTTDTTIVGFSGGSSVIGNATITGYAIKTATNGDILANPTTTTNLEAFSAIALRPDFKTQVQTSLGLFRAYLKPTAMGCAVGSNALIVQTATYNCPGNASVNRFANFTNQDNTDEAINKLTLAEELQNIRLKIAPNPNNGSFSLLFNKKVNSGTVILYNGMGQEVHRQYLTSDAETYELNLNEYLTPGAYYLSWNNATFVIRQKFIVN
jgi:hypothetical protein